MANIRKNLQDKPISKRAAKRITAAKSSDTRENYESLMKNSIAGVMEEKLTAFNVMYHTLVFVSPI